MFRLLVLKSFDIEYDILNPQCIKIVFDGLAFCTILSLHQN